MTAMDGSGKSDEPVAEWDLPAAGAAPAWWANPTLVLIGIGIVVPNLLAAAALAFDIGLPPRPIPILGYCLVAGMARWRSPRTMACLYLLVLAYDLVSTVSGMFGLSMLEIGSSVRFAGETRLLSSPLYLGLAACVTGLVCVMPWLFRRAHVTLRSARIGPAMVLVIGLSVCPETS